VTGQTNWREVCAYADQHGSRAASDKYGIPKSTINGKRRSANQAHAAAHEHRHDAGADLSLDAAFLHQHPEFTDKKVASLDMWGMFDLIQGMQEAVGASGHGQHEARITIPTTEPVILLPSSDWHLGSYATTHAGLRDYLQRVLALDGVYLVLLGDLIDNFPASFKSAEAVFGQVIPPNIQKRLLGRILRTLADSGKVLARTWGNHEEMSAKIIGGDDNEYDGLMPYLKTMGRIHLTVGATEYKVFASHTFPGRSYIHGNHQHVRAVRFLWPDADLIMSGDTHRGPEHEVFLHDGRPRVAVLTGTQKTDDTYGQRYYGRSQRSEQAVVLFPDEHRMVPFNCLDDALVYRDGWRARKAA
jgi:hypothetical protein